MNPLTMSCPITHGIRVNVIKADMNLKKRHYSCFEAFGNMGPAELLEHCNASFKLDNVARLEMF